MAATKISERELLFGDLERELGVTRKVLERLPEDKFGWTPHEKSMKLGRLAMHVATLPDWARTALADEGLDMATAPHPRVEPNDKDDLLKTFDKTANELREVVRTFDPQTIGRMWTIRNGSQIIAAKTKAIVYRVWCMNHLLHHRGQLCLYLRLLNVPVPTVYFNSSDEPDWKFE